MKELDNFIKRFGRSTYVSQDGWTSHVYNAVIEPLRYKNKMYLYGSYNELGHYPEAFFLYIGPASVSFDCLNDSAIVHTSDGKSYLIHHWEKVYIKDKPVYIWAVIKERIE